MRRGVVRSGGCVVIIIFLIINNINDGLDMISF
jgi:hypothetical protein